MDIVITFDRNGWTIDPSPAIVAIGTNVRFVVRSKRSTETDLEWIIDFRNRSPFDGINRWQLKTRNSGLGARDGGPRRVLRDVVPPESREDVEYDHRAASPAAGANEPGEYKYDLEVKDAGTGFSVGREDPLLIVL